MMKFDVEGEVIKNLDKNIEKLEKEIKAIEIRLQAIKETKKELENIVQSIIEKNLPF